MDQMTADQVGDAMANLVLGQSAQPAEPEQPQRSEPVTASNEAGQGEVEVTEAKQEAQPEPETIEIDPDAELFEMELDENGQKVSKKLALRELQKGYLRQSDYTRKTQDLARQRAEVQESTRQARQEAVKQYQEKLEQFQAALTKTVAPELGNVDWNKLATEDPFEYVRLSNRARQINEVLQAIESEKSKAVEQSKSEEQQRKAERWNKTVEHLRESIPDWGQPVVQKLAKAAKEAGATEDQINSLDEAWIIKLAHKAALYDELKSTPVEKKVAVVPKVLKPGQKAPTTAQSDRLKAWAKGGGKLTQDGADAFAKFV